MPGTTISGSSSVKNNRGDKSTSMDQSPESLAADEARLEMDSTNLKNRIERDKKSKSSENKQTTSPDQNNKGKKKLNTPGDVILKGMVGKGASGEEKGKDGQGGDGDPKKEVHHPVPGDMTGEGSGAISLSQAVHDVDEKGEVAGGKVDLSELVNKVMVSTDGLKTGKEVRMVVSDSLLPATEMKIERSQGVLHVQFSTSAAESRQLLMTVQTDLQDRLTRHLGDEVSVEVISTQMQGGDDNEGRSRQRRNLVEEMKNR
jgi:type III secretion system needle length determinant